MAFYFVLSVCYIRIKQKFIAAKVNQLVDQVSHDLRRKSLFRNARHKIMPFNTALWGELCRINRQTLNIYDEIRGNNAFWDRYLTIDFVVYLFQICYEAYLFIFVLQE